MAPRSLARRLLIVPLALLFVFDGAEALAPTAALESPRRAQNQAEQGSPMDAQGAAPVSYQPPPNHYLFYLL